MDVFARKIITGKTTLAYCYNEQGYFTKKEIFPGAFQIFFLFLVYSLTSFVPSCAGTISFLVFLPVIYDKSRLSYPHLFVPMSLFQRHIYDQFCNIKSFWDRNKSKFYFRRIYYFIK